MGRRAGRPNGQDGGGLRLGLRRAPPACPAPRSRFVGDRRDEVAQVLDGLGHLETAASMRAELEACDFAREDSSSSNRSKRSDIDGSAGDGCAAAPKALSKARCGVSAPGSASATCRSSFLVSVQPSHLVLA